MSDDEEHDEYMGAELYAAERHAEAAESLLRDAVIRADAAEKRVAVLEEALRFYAHPMNWRVGGEFMPASPDNDRRPDCGDTARQALATTEGE